MLLPMVLLYLSYFVACIDVMNAKPFGVTFLETFPRPGSEETCVDFEYENNSYGANSAHSCVKVGTFHYCATEKSKQTKLDANSFSDNTKICKSKCRKEYIDPLQKQHRAASNNLLDSVKLVQAAKDGRLLILEQLSVEFVQLSVKFVQTAKDMLRLSDLEELIKLKIEELKLKSEQLSLKFVQAAKEGRVLDLKELIKKGADLYKEDSTKGNTAHEYFVEQNNFPGIKLLVRAGYFLQAEKEGRRLDLEKLIKLKLEQLSLKFVQAAKEDRLLDFEELIKKGANLRKEDSKGNTAHDYFVEQNNFPGIQLLVRAGYFPHSESNIYGYCPCPIGKFCKNKDLSIHQSGCADNPIPNLNFGYYAPTCSNCECVDKCQTDETCCSKLFQCAENEGHCESDAGCRDGLKCVKGGCNWAEGATLETSCCVPDDKQLYIKPISTTNEKELFCNSYKLPVNQNICDECMNWNDPDLDHGIANAQFKSEEPPDSTCCARPVNSTLKMPMCFCKDKNTHKDADKQIIVRMVCEKVGNPFIGGSYEILNKFKPLSWVLPDYLEDVNRIAKMNDICVDENAFDENKDFKGCIYRQHRPDPYWITQQEGFSIFGLPDGIFRSVGERNSDDFTMNGYYDNIFFDKVGSPVVVRINGKETGGVKKVQVSSPVKKLKLNLEPFEDSLLDSDSESPMTPRQTVIHRTELNGVRSMLITNTDMTKVDTDVFMFGGKNIYDYSIKYNQRLMIIENAPFKSLINLRVLHIEYNNLEYIGHDAFTGLSQLRVLSLAHNSHLFTDGGIPLRFGGLKHLHTLNLEATDLQRLHPTLWGLPSGADSTLRELVLRNNKLGVWSPKDPLPTETFSAILRDHHRIVRLDFSDNGIEKFSDHILQKLPYLESLYLQGNSLREIPRGMVTFWNRVQNCNHKNPRYPGWLSLKSAFNKWRQSAGKEDLIEQDCRDSEMKYFDKVKRKLVKRIDNFQCDLSGNRFICPEKYSEDPGTMFVFEEICKGSCEYRCPDGTWMNVTHVAEHKRRKQIFHSRIAKFLIQSTPGDIEELKASHDISQSSDLMCIPCDSHTWSISRDEDLIATSQKDCEYCSYEAKQSCGEFEGRGRCAIIDNGVKLCYCTWWYSGSDDCSFPVVASIFVVTAGCLLTLLFLIPWIVYFKVLKNQKIEELKDMNQIVAEHEKVLVSRGRKINGMREAWRITEDTLTFGEKLAMGSFGEVWSGKWNRVNVAIKCFLRDQEQRECLDSENKQMRSHNFDDDEISIFMTTSRHQRIVCFYGAGIDSKGNQFMVSEFMEGGALSKKLWACPREDISWEMKLTYCRDIAEGMSYLHRHGVLHRDLKTPNILICGNGNCKVADFGLSKVFDEPLTQSEKSGRLYSSISIPPVSPKNGFFKSIKQFFFKSHNAQENSSKDQNNVSETEDVEANIGDRDSTSFDEELLNHFEMTMTTGVGSYMWMPPELHESHSNQTRYGSSMDVYAFGIIMWEIMAQEQPWANVKHWSTIRRLVNSGCRPKSERERSIRANAPAGYCELMEECWQQDMHLRPSFEIVFDRLSRMTIVPHGSATNSNRGSMSRRINRTSRKVDNSHSLFHY